MSEPVDLYDSTYTLDAEPVLGAVRRETYGTDIGQTSWTTAAEYRRIAERLGATSGKHVLEIASGTGGPALYLARMAGCRVTGVDVNAHGIEGASARARAAGLVDRVNFQHADATRRLPFEDASFDALLCMDAVNHLLDRAGVLREWRRVLKPGGRGFFTDPVLVTGLVTDEEFAARSSIGRFVFAPAGHNERLIEASGLALLEVEDLSDAGARVAAAWCEARARHAEPLRRLEGDERFAGLQRFLGTVERLMGERRLSRVGYLVERPR